MKYIVTSIIIILYGFSAIGTYTVFKRSMPDLTQKELLNASVFWPATLVTLNIYNTIDEIQNRGNNDE